MLRLPVRPRPADRVARDGGRPHERRLLPHSHPHFEAVDQYLLQVERFSRLVRGEPVPARPMEDALISLETIDALFASAREGGWRELGGI